MKMEEYNQPETEKLARYLCDEMSETESKAFADEMYVSEANKTSIEKMKKQWSAINQYQESKTPDTNKAWKKLYSRLDSENLIPATEKPAGNSTFTTMLRIAAVVVVLLGIGSAVYFSVNRKPAVEMLSVNTSSEANTLIKTLADGSVIYIAQNSSFSFPKEFENKSRNVELKGEAFFDIAPNPAKPFIIETGEAFIEVLGTAFNVKTQNGKALELCVDRGKVKVTLKNNPSHSSFVVAGEKVTSFENTLVKSKNASGSTWYKKRMHFKDEPLRNIISVLNRNFSTTFVVPEKETGDRKLTVTLNQETEATLTEIICVALNLKSQNINGSVILSENKNSASRN